MKILVAGDFHGDLDHMGHIAQIAHNQECKWILQVGDFGYWPHTDPTMIEKYSHTLRKQELKCAFIDGNHEAFSLDITSQNPKGRGLLQLRSNGAKVSPDGFTEISPVIFHIPRGTRWKWGNTVFLGLGGGYSIDKDLRVELERQSGNRTRWWSQELITHEEAVRATLYSDPSLADVQVMITHDAPAGTIDFPHVKNHPYSVQNQRRVKDVVDAVRPNILIHGHYHIHRENIYRFMGGRSVKVIGLGDNLGEKNKSWMVMQA